MHNAVLQKRYMGFLDIFTQQLFSSEMFNPAQAVEHTHV